jgi:hypothetical protein
LVPARPGPLPILATALLADTVLGALYAFAGAAMDKPGGSAVPAAAAAIGVPVIAASSPLRGCAFPRKLLDRPRPTEWRRRRASHYAVERLG